MRIRELGHVVLYVTNLKRSVKFYRDVLGFPLVAQKQAMALFSSGRTHHELLLIEVGGLPETKNYLRPGLYHMGFKIGNSARDVQRAYHELREKDIPIVGTGDHTITHSIYVLDPDGNEIELYADISDRWRENPKLILTPVRPLELEE